VIDKESRYRGRLWLAGNISPGLAPASVRPTDVSIKLTENCQARCVTCDYWKSRWTDHIDTQMAVDLIGRLGEIGVTTLRFTGGEPLLRRDFFDILKTADTSMFTTIGVQTNGLLLTRLADEVNASPLTHVSISLDAVGDRNDAIRGVRGYFDRATSGLRLVEGKTRIVAVTLNQVGVDDLETIIDLVEELGGFLACNLPDDRLYFLQDANLSGLWPDEQASERIVEILHRRLPAQFTDYELDYIRRYLSQTDSSARDINPPCVLGYTTIYIASDGTVRSGCYVLPALGNIHESDIEEIIGSADYRSRALAMLRLECPGCACNVFKSLRTRHALQDQIAGAVGSLRTK
jgi:MoaA/NifB/PqqE/SkfB family radical SAM enzyme